MTLYYKNKTFTLTFKHGPASHSGGGVLRSDGATLRMCLALAEHLKDPTAGSGRVRRSGPDEAQGRVNASGTPAERQRNASDAKRRLK